MKRSWLQYEIKNGLLGEMVLSCTKCQFIRFESRFDVYKKHRHVIKSKQAVRCAALICIYTVCVYIYKYSTETQWSVTTPLLVSLTHAGHVTADVEITFVTIEHHPVAIVLAIVAVDLHRRGTVLGVSTIDSCKRARTRL